MPKERPKERREQDKSFYNILADFPAAKEACQYANYNLDEIEDPVLRDITVTIRQFSERFQNIYVELIINHQAYRTYNEAQKIEYLKSVLATPVGDSTIENFEIGASIKTGKEIKEKEGIIATLTNRVKELIRDIWNRDQRIEKLETELTELKDQKTQRPNQDSQIEELRRSSRRAFIISGVATLFSVTAIGSCLINRADKEDAVTKAQKRLREEQEIVLQAQQESKEKAERERQEEEERKKNNLKQRVKDLEKEMMDKFGIKIINGPHNWDPNNKKGEALETEGFIKMMESLLIEMPKYPLEFIKNIGFKRLIFTKFVKDKYYDKKEGKDKWAETGGSAGGGEITMTSNGEWLNLNTLHHEITHLMFGKYGNESWWKNQPCNIPQWEKDGKISATKTFCYPKKNFSGWDFVISDEEGKIKEKDLVDRPFVEGDIYGATCPHEDAAVLGEKLMIPQEHRKFLEYINNLKGGSKKAGIIDKINELKRYYFNASKGKMDWSFWNDLLNEGVGPDYWAKR